MQIETLYNELSPAGKARVIADIARDILRTEIDKRGLGVAFHTASSYISSGLVDWVDDVEQGKLQIEL